MTAWSGNFFLAAGTLWQRELVRFFRQRSRVVGALGPPILFWFLIGSGLGASFQLAGLPTGQAGFSGSAQGTGVTPPSRSAPSPVSTGEGRPASNRPIAAIGGSLERGGGVTYLQYFFPGTIALIVLFTAIFSTISIIEDRHEGFLQSVLVAPALRTSLVLGNIAGGTTLAFIQGLIFLCFAPLVGITIHPAPLLFLLAVLLVISFGLTALGFVLAWQLDSAQGFHAIMNLFLIPMWLLSGALFPLTGAPAWLRAVMRINPLTYGIAAMRESFLVHGRPLPGGVIAPLPCLAVIFLFSVLTYAAAVACVRRR